MLSLPPHRSAVWSAKHSSVSRAKMNRKQQERKNKLKFLATRRGEDACCIPFFWEPAGVAACPWAGPLRLRTGKPRGGREVKHPRDRAQGSLALKRWRRRLSALSEGGLLGSRGEPPAAHPRPVVAAGWHGHRRAAPAHPPRSFPKAPQQSDT